MQRFLQNSTGGRIRQGVDCTKSSFRHNQIHTLLIRYKQLVNKIALYLFHSFRMVVSEHHNVLVPKFDPKPPFLSRGSW